VVAAMREALRKAVRMVAGVLNMIGFRRMRDKLGQQVVAKLRPSPLSRITEPTSLRQDITYKAARASKIFGLKILSLATGGKALSNSSAAALLTLEGLHIPVRGPFVTPTRKHIFLINDCILTEDELVSLHKGGQLASNTIAKCLTELRREQAPAYEKQRRSQRIHLKLPLLLRTTMRGGHRQTEATTVVVNAHGGLLEAPFRMHDGQRMTLVNPQTGKQVNCRVVKILSATSSSFATAFEFDEQTPAFWPLAFPPLDWAIPASSPA
jgi:hypothetical protein